MSFERLEVEKTLNYSAAQTTVSEVGDGALTVTYYLTGATDETDLKTTQIYDISFDRASGSLKPQGGSVYLEYFKVTNGRKTLTVKILSEDNKIIYLSEKDIREIE